MKNVVAIYSCSDAPSIAERPIYTAKIAAGFPSPAEDHIDATLDLNEYLIHHPAATYFVRVSGDSMINAGIVNNDVLIVDRSLDPKHGDIVVAELMGEFTVKRLHHRGQELMLCPENELYQPIVIRQPEQLHIVGVVTGVVRKFKSS